MKSLPKSSPPAIFHQSQPAKPSELALAVVIAAAGAVSAIISRNLELDRSTVKFTKTL